jgi:hypothetical protein
MAILTVQDVITRVQRQFGDEAAVQVTEADILRWINDAQREAVMQNEGLLQAIGYIDLVAGQQEYDLPADCFTLGHVQVKSSAGSEYYSVQFRSLKQLAEELNGYIGSSKTDSYPVFYTSQRTGKVVLFPAPEASVAQGIQIFYSRFATDVVDTGSTIDLPPEYGSMVVNFCLAQAYEMDEDWEASQVKSQQVQGDLDFNNNRQFWFGRDSYPTISTDFEDA